MRAILVDDESMAIEVLENLLVAYEDDIKIVGSYTNPQQALKEIKEKDVDVVFLDIELGRVNGLEMAGLFLQAKAPLEIVLVTAYSSYALDAFEIDALDYLLKPIQKDRLEKTIERLKNKIGDLSTDSLYVKGFGSLELLDRLNRVINWRTQKTKEVFAFLWSNHNKPITKNLFIENIFPDMSIDKANTYLHTTIYQIRKILEDGKCSEGLIFSGGAYILKSNIRSDVKEVYDIITSKNLKEKNIQSVLDLYRCDFLQDEDYIWATNMREKLKNMVAIYLESYVNEGLRKGNSGYLLETVIKFLMDLDPYNEELAIYMLNYYGTKASYVMLKKFYEDYRNFSLEELGVRPSQNFTNVYLSYKKKGQL